MSKTVAFDRFTINPANRRLYADGAPLAVSTPGVRLLLALIERNGALVTKDELLTLVWGSSPVSENTLHSQVSELRRAIGNHLIITQSGVGYRFVGKLKSSQQPTAQRDAAPRRRAGAPHDLLGRDTQLAEVAKTLARHRRVTLIGPGGVGKTSLARALIRASAAEYPDGVWFIELAAQRDLAGILDTIHGAMQTEGPVDTVSTGNLVAALRSRRALLVLDNCEQVLADAAQLAEDLACGTQALAIMATSRQALGYAGEQVMTVPTLPVPDESVDTVRQARRSAAFRLFADRIAALDPQFVMGDAQVPAASRICRALDGLPLALEIVAGWARVLGIDTLEEKLKSAPMAWPHGRRSAPARHHDLRAALGWSHDLLSDAEQIVLRRLAVFAHDFSLAAAEAVAGGDNLPPEAVFRHLASLEQKSLVAVTPGARRPSYRLLATTRAFALEKLAESGEAPQVRDRHAKYVLSELSEADIAWESCASETWLGQYAPIVMDQRLALDWAVGDGGDSLTGLSITAVSGRLWRELSLRVEGARRIGAALAQLRPDTPAAIIARLRQGQALMHTDDQPELACEALEEAIGLYRRIGDRKRLGATLLLLAFLRFQLGQIDRVEAAAEEGRSLLQGTDSQRNLVQALEVEAALHAHHRRFEQARETLGQALRLYEALGAERSALTTRSNLLDVALGSGDIAATIADGRGLAARLRGTPHTGLLGIVLVNVVAALVRARHFAEAVQLAREAAPLLAGHKPLSVVIEHLALACALQGRLQDAAMLIGFADHASTDRGWPRQPVEQFAIDQAQSVLEAGLPRDAIARLRQNGALLTEASAWALAVFDPEAAPAGVPPGNA